MTSGLRRGRRYRAEFPPRRPLPTSAWRLRWGCGRDPPDPGARPLGGDCHLPPSSGHVRPQGRPSPPSQRRARRRVTAGHLEPRNAGLSEVPCVPADAPALAPSVAEDLTPRTLR